ncbi:MAG: PilZ domain-containing protein [Butyricicoccus pullicaecorum]|nr:PilZ domain-containing protein [Butyricicoccus pullicaecorum]
MSTLKGLFGKQEEEIFEEQESDEVSVKNFVGIICQVENADTKDYFMGRIEEYDADMKELKISGYRMDSIPVQICYNAPVRIQIKSGEQLTFIYAAARKQSHEFWWVAVEDIDQRSEQREGFRQPLSGVSAIIRHINGEQETIPCKLVDISLTGICVCCEEALQIGERIDVQEVCLYPDAPESYTFACEVRRAFIRGKDNKIIHLGEEKPQESEENIGSQEAQSHDEQESKEIYYGCSFYHISLEDKEKLCKELFVAQQHRRTH